MAYTEFEESHDSGDDVIEMQSSTPRTNTDRIQKRDYNFTSQESEKLINLVIKYKNTVESKGNDTRQCKLKERIWQKIETEFNDNALESFRTNKTLKLRYNTIKSTLRKKCRLLKADPINAEPLDLMETRLNEMLLSELPDKAPDIGLDSRTGRTNIILMLSDD